MRNASVLGYLPPPTVVMSWEDGTLALAIMEAYRRFATARSARPPRRLKWFQEIFEEDWVRYLDAARDGRALDSG